MKQMFVFGSIAMYAFIAFVPPAGMTKLPVTHVQFQVNPTQGSFTASVVSPEKDAVKASEAEKKSSEEADGSDS